MRIQLISINELQAWDKNPRERDPERFEWIQLSLLKFGFVTPVFAREDGLLYSGHQRSSAAKAIGLERVPVVFLPGYDDATERSINVVFNLCTNDHATKGDFGKNAAVEVRELIHLVRDLPNATNFYPCLDWFAINPITYLPQ